MCEMIFNDVSLTVHQISQHSEAESCFQEFVCTLGEVVSRKLAQPVLRSQIFFQDIAINTLNEGEWLVEDWLQNPHVDRDQRIFILTLDSKVPIENGIDLLPSQEDELIDYEYKVPSSSGYDVFAFGFALQANHLAVSLPSSPVWDACPIGVFVCRNGTFIRNAVVDHVSREVHCDSLSQILLNRRIDSIFCADDFVQAKEEVFPYLQFSPDVDAQVKQIEPYYLAFMIEKLVKMNETSAQWNECGSLAPEYRFQWRPESEATMNQDELRKARTFRKPSGKKDVFENHLSFSKQHRIHFIEDRTAKTFIIGYIGDHLPTVKYTH